MHVVGLKGLCASLKWKESGAFGLLMCNNINCIYWNHTMSMTPRKMKVFENMGMDDGLFICVNLSASLLSLI